MKPREFILLCIHLVFISELFYDIALFLGTSYDNQEVRRLYAYEGWIVASFYMLFIVLTFIARDSKFTLKNPHKYLKSFKKVLTAHLLLFVFPWGVFVLTAPQRLLHILGIDAPWIKILSFLSIISAFLYYLPVHLNNKKTSQYAMLIGFITTLLTAIGFAILFLMGVVPVVIISTIPLLLYCSYFFWEHSGKSVLHVKN